MTTKRALEIGIIISILGGTGQCSDTKEQQSNTPISTTQKITQPVQKNSIRTQTRTHLDKEYKGISYGTLYGVSLISSDLIQPH